MEKEGGKRCEDGSNAKEMDGGRVARFHKRTQRSEWQRKRKDLGRAFQQRLGRKFDQEWYPIEGCKAESRLQWGDDVEVAE